MRLTASRFAKKILGWFDKAGRKNLPWQVFDPYCVWISEIMLQQTQVTTVIPYYERFIQGFPTVFSLAQAELDEVLALWSGLGYYARGRNIWHCAKLIVAEYQGKFPKDLDKLMALPGIGRSTAGAILSLAMQYRAPILDGNVKRVLTRYIGVYGWPGNAQIAKQLWGLSDYYTPQQRIADYTQAMMDLGAIVCTRTKPLCNQCPLIKTCFAYHKQVITDLPSKKPKKHYRRKKFIFYY